MHHDQEILTRLEAEAGSFSDEVFRLTIGKTTATRENVTGARWNPEGVPAIYTSLERETAIAEVGYHLSLQKVRTSARLVLHTVRVNLLRVVDLRSPALLKELGIDLSDLSGDEWEACQALGAAAAHVHCDGLLVASARRSDGSNLVVLAGNDHHEGFAFERIDSEVLDPDDAT